MRPLPCTRVLAPADDADETPDLVALQADDELINALGARLPAPRHHSFPVDVPPPWTGPRDLGGRDLGGRDLGGRDLGDTGARTHDDRIVAMLAAWRQEIDDDPIPELVDLDTAVAAVVAGVRAQESAARESAARESATRKFAVGETVVRDLAARRRRVGPARHLAPLAAAAAIAVAVLGGVGLGSQDAVPGDPLWQIQKVVNPERAESLEARVQVETRLAKVRTALRNGDTATAAQELEAIRTQMPVVRAEEGLPLLVQEEEFLAAKLADTPPGKPADLSTPPVSNPAARSTSSPAVPAGPAPSDPPSSGSTPADPTVPDVASVPATPGEVLVPPARSGQPGPDVAKSSPPVTTAPDDTRPEKPVATPPGPRNDEGRADPTGAPVPAEPPAPSPRESSAPEVAPTSGTDTTTTGTTAASDTAGAGDGTAT